MATVITDGDFRNLRKRFHRSTTYLSVLSPLTLWEVLVNVGDPERGRTSIPFDTGSGLDFTAIKVGQVVWLGTGVGKKDVGVLRIRGITSGDSGVTGTLTVGWHPYTIGNNAFLSFVHDYPVHAKYTWLGQDAIMGSEEVLYKDVFDEYTDQTKANEIKPVASLRVEPRAGFIRDGELIYWVNAGSTYPMSPGASIGSYALSIYPSTGTTVTFNTVTGVGYVRVTDLTQSYYWLQLIVTDSNSSTRTFYKCVFAYDPDASAGNYPIKDMEIGQYSDDWESGGVTTQVTLHAQLSDVFSGDRAPTDMIDAATCVLWRENVVGERFLNERYMPTIRAGEYLYIVPEIAVSVTTSGTCDIVTTFRAGVRINNIIPANGTPILLNVQINSETSIKANGIVNDGVVAATITWNGLLAGCSNGTLKWFHGSVLLASMDVWPGKVTQAYGNYPSRFISFPTNILAGYIRENEVRHDTEVDTGTHEYSLNTPEAMLKQNFMFSIPIDAREGSSQSHWSHFHSQMTTAAAAFFVLDFHSNALNVIDVIGLNKDNDPRAYGQFDSASLYQMINSITFNEGIRAYFKCNRDGELHMIYDVQLLTDDERDALPIVADVAKQDRSGQISIKDNPEPKTALVYGDGLHWGGEFDMSDSSSPTYQGVGDAQVDPYCALAPWYIPGWGGGESAATFQLQTVRSQEHLNEITGRRFGQLNNPYPTFRWAWRGDWLDVLNMDFEEFWTITIQTVDNRKGLVFATQKIILRNVEATIDAKTGTLLINTTWEPEAAAYPAVAAVCPEIDFDLGGIQPEWDEWPSLLPGTIVTSS